MKHDVDHYQPYKDNFKLEILHADIASKRMANLVEQGCIRLHDTIASGYNTLDGTPCADPRYWGRFFGRQ